MSPLSVNSQLSTAMRITWRCATKRLGTRALARAHSRDILMSAILDACVDETCLVSLLGQPAT